MSTPEGNEELVVLRALLSFGCEPAVGKEMVRLGETDGIEVDVYNRGADGRLQLLFKHLRIWMSRSSLGKFKTEI